MPAIVIDNSTASGAATCNERQNASSGTATSASPKPNAERISVAIKTISRTSTEVRSIGISAILIGYAFFTTTGLTTTGLRSGTMAPDAPGAAWWKRVSISERTYSTKLCI